MLSVKHSNLGQLLGKSSSDHGMHKLFAINSRFSANIMHSGKHPSAAQLESSLRAYKGTGHIKHLLEYQIESISNIVYRPQEVHVVGAVYKRNANYYQRCTDKDTGSLDNTVSIKASADYREDRDCDIGRAVVNDLFTGSGEHSSL
jgi:hypothetical protein